MTKAPYLHAIQRTDVLSTLAAFDPHVAGTPPLGLDLPASDIDILCHAPDPDRFATAIWSAFGSQPDFRMWQWCGGSRAIIASFSAEGWCFEIFGEGKPVSQQAGWRHFTVEQRLIALGGQRLLDAVMGFRRAGLKTEPAFAAALNLQGDAYQALLEIASWDDGALARLISSAENRS